ncbi:MAG: hypothetical protein ACNA7V_07585 [Bacteroidales bacterium]
MNRVTSASSATTVACGAIRKILVVERCPEHAEGLVETTLD